MISILVLLSTSVLISYIFSLKQIYQLQITEYRFDRFMTMLRDAGFSTLLKPGVVLPAKTLRNVAIAFFSFFFLIVLNYVFYYFFSDNLFLILIVSLLNYFIAKDVVFVSSMIFKPFAEFSRKKRIEEAGKKVDSFGVDMIGITGSFGKSSVKEYVFKIFSEKYSLERTSGNRNTDIGVALEIKEKLKKDLDFFVCEMGAYKIGEIKNICEFVKPKYGILTGIGNQHMDLFGSIENLVKAKSELIVSLPEDGVAVVNIDNDFKEELLKDVKAKTITYGWSEDADFRLLNLSYKKRLMFVEFSGFGKKYKFTTALLGDHQAVNLLGIVALALELKISYEAIQNAIAKMEPLEGKLSFHKGVNESAILNDGYNSNLHGYLSALDVLKKFEAKKKYVFNYGIFELGKEREGAYRQIVDHIVKNNIVLLTLDKRFAKLNSENVIYMKSEKDVMEFLKKNLQKDEALLLEGRCTDDFLNFLDMEKYEVRD